MSTIRVFTSYNESSNARKYRMFDIIDSLPEVGGTYNGEEVKEVNSVYLDAEQDSDEVYNYDYYHIITKCLDAEDQEDESDYFVAVESIIRMTVREKIEELNDDGITEIKLYSNATNAELELTDSNLDAELAECIIADDTADLYI